MWVVMIVGLPLAIVSQLAWGPETLGAPDGEQPGGLLKVRIVLEDGTPVEGASVEFQVWPTGGEAETSFTAKADAEGRATAEVPAVRGKYRVLAGGGQWRRTGRERSFVDGRGEAVKLSEVELVLKPAAQARLIFTREDAAAPTSGQLRFNGKTREGALFGLLGHPIAVDREFEGGEILLDGLPPAKGELRVRFADGAVLNTKLILVECEEPAEHRWSL